MKYKTGQHRRQTNKNMCNDREHLQDQMNNNNRWRWSDEKQIDEVSKLKIADAKGISNTAKSEKATRKGNWKRKTLIHFLQLLQHCSYCIKSSIQCHFMFQTCRITIQN